MAEDRLLPMIKPINNDLKKIETLVQSVDSDVQVPLSSMLRHSLVGGKRLRPAFIVLVGDLFKVQRKKLHVLAAAIEVLHSATLIHDDLVDDSPRRRGRKTLNAVWPQGATVLAGDYLLARSVSLIAELGNPDVLGVLAKALYTMSAGEINYHYSRQSKKGREVYFGSIEAKTASLFAAAARMVGLLAGQSKTCLGMLGLFGREFGIAYQIFDDVLDYIGTERHLGKPAGSDLAGGVITLPAICYLERRPEDETIERILSGKHSRRDLATALRLVRESGAIEDALEEARVHARKSKGALVKLPAARSRQTLFKLIDYIVERTH
jgi:geranylgeranyl pyrophosphate synthase